MTIRRFRPDDVPLLWTLSSVTTDLDVPFPLVPSSRPSGLPDLVDIPASFIDTGGEFLVVELDSHLAGMGGIRPTDALRAEVKRVRVHPASRRRGVGRALMTALERRAIELGFRELHLDTLDEPNSMGLYRGLGYDETHREPGASCTVVYLQKSLPG